MTRSRSSSACTSLPLVSGSAADIFNEKGADPPLRIVSGYSRFAAIHDMPDAIDRDGSLGDIGRNDYFAQRIRKEREVLIFGRQIAVERNERKSLFGSRGPDGSNGRVDLAHARHKD